jgi:hypothetical protein
MRGVLSSGGKPRQYAPTSQLPRLGGRDPIAAQAAGSAAPTARIAELERRLRFNSLNSSKTASRDRLKKPARTFQRTVGQAKKSQGRTPAAGRRSLPLGLFWMRRGVRKRMRARLSADHALPAGSVGLQDRAAWPASVFEDQRGHVGDVWGDPRTLHAYHARKETLFLGHRDLLTLSFSRSVTPETSRRRRSRAQNASKRQNRGPKRRHAAQLGVGAPCAAKRAENPP